MSKQNKHGMRLSDRDLQILYFLWRWKLGTTKAIANKFFPDLNPVVAYDRLLQLKNRRFLECHSFGRNGRDFIWTLSSHGFRTISFRLPQLKEEGFRSEYVEHDLYVAAVHLGEWLTSERSDIEIFTEQELRRLSHYPDWVPTAQSHRPDGYWRVPYNGQKITIALEVELNSKTRPRYGAIAQFYRLNTDVFRVVWLVDSLAKAKSLRIAIEKEIQDECVKHNFILISDFEKLSWEAPVHLGAEAGKTLNYVLGNHLGEAWGQNLEPQASPFFDTRKYPGDYRTYALKNSPRTNNRVSIRPSSPNVVSIPKSSRPSLAAIRSFSSTLRTGGR